MPRLGAAIGRGLLLWLGLLLGTLVFGSLSIGISVILFVLLPETDSLVGVLLVLTPYAVPFIAEVFFVWLTLRLLQRRRSLQAVIGAGIWSLVGLVALLPLSYVSPFRPENWDSSASGFMAIIGLYWFLLMVAWGTVCATVGALLWSRCYFVQLKTGARVLPNKRFNLTNLGRRA